LTTVLAIAGCAKKTPPPAPLPTPPPVVAAPPSPPPLPPAPQPSPAAAGLTEDELFARKSLADLNAEMPLGDVLFDYDQSELREEARALLQRNAQWLARWSSVRITIEGHGDSRGTAEYNLSLGERRADAIDTYLSDLGISAQRMLVISKGEEAPFCEDETESCWEQNRRGHFVITAK
jgi:peptidoglycan-associated lipoprotein